MSHRRFTTQHSGLMHRLAGDFFPIITSSNGVLVSAMLNFSRLSSLSVGALLTVGLVDAQSQEPSTTTFFGGIENEAYLEWFQRASYERTEFLPSPAGNSTGAALHWTIQENEILLAVAAKATGWVGFGIAESGGMFGADTVVYLADSDSLVDGYILDERVVMPDDCQSWTLLNSTNNGGFLIFEAKRLLDTGDTQDRPIPQDGDLTTPPSRVIAAWSDLPSIQNHGPNNRASTILRFRASQEGFDFETAMASEAEGFIDIMANDHPIKPMDTEYAYFCVSLADMIAQGMPADTELHTIGFEPIIDPRAAKHVHHFILQASMDGNATTGSNCSAIDFIDMAYLWAPGEGPFQLPDNIGSPLGEKGFKSFQLEVHYDNPWLKTDVLDSSGVRLYYTSKKRQHNLGLFMLGDPFVQLFGQPVGSSTHRFDCPSSCSSFALSENVTVIREYLHMHKVGTTMTNEHFRDGNLIRAGQVEFYDFSQQGGFVVQQEPFQIQPGDSFQTTCQYTDNEAVFGLSSSEEMCIAFLMYYPMQIMSFGEDSPELPFICGYDTGIPGCTSDWEQTDLVSVSDLNRTFGDVGEVCNGVTTTTTSGVLPVASNFVGTVIALAMSMLCVL